MSDDELAAMGEHEAARQLQLQTGMSIMLSERSRQAVEQAKRELITEGERRATAAIVADLRERTIEASGWLATRYERGDHLAKDKSA
jgi:hypothetical protein